MELDMTIEHKYAQFLLTEQAIMNFEYLAEMSVAKDSSALSLVITTNILNASGEDLREEPR
jgi:hypothetical protein